MATTPLPHAAAAAISGLDVAGIDRAVRPGDDFFAYANGAWIKATAIPPDRSAWGSGEIVIELTRKRTAELIQSAGQAAVPHSDAMKIGTYYAAYMDEAAVESAGLKPLQPGLSRIAAINDRAALAQALGATLRADVDFLNNTNLHTENLFGLWVAQDLSDPSRYAAFLLQGGLGMPDRDFYLNPSQRWPTSAPSTRRTSPGCSVSRSYRRPRHARRASWGSSGASPQAHWSRAGHRGRAQGQQPLEAPPTLRSARPGWTGEPSSRPQALPSRPTSWSGSRAPSRASRP